MWFCLPTKPIKATKQRESEDCYYYKCEACPILPLPYSSPSSYLSLHRHTSLQAIAGMAKPSQTTSRAEKLTKACKPTKRLFSHFTRFRKRKCADNHLVPNESQTPIPPSILEIRAVTTLNTIQKDPFVDKMRRVPHSKEEEKIQRLDTVVNFFSASFETEY